MQQKTSILPGLCIDCGIPTFRRVSGIRFELIGRQLYSEELNNTPLCGHCTEASPWFIPASWLAEEAQAKAWLADWERHVEAAQRAA